MLLFEKRARWSLSPFHVRRWICCSWISEVLKPWARNPILKCMWMLLTPWSGEIVPCTMNKSSNLCQRICSLRLHRRICLPLSVVLVPQETQLQLQLFVSSFYARKPIMVRLKLCTHLISQPGSCWVLYLVARGARVGIVLGYRWIEAINRQASWRDWSCAWGRQS